MFEVIYVANGKKLRLQENFASKEVAMIEVRALWAVGINAWVEKI